MRILSEKNIVEQIIEKEWPMFHTVNGTERVGCQEDYRTFAAMRRAQFSTWSDEAAENYLQDLIQAEGKGRNLVREKYIRMMKITDPVGYEHFQQELPPVSAEGERLAAEIWQHMLQQTKRMREKYPDIAQGGRPLYSGEEGEYGGWASIETYQMGELLTYSEKTLQALLRHIEELEREGRDLAFEIQLRSIQKIDNASAGDTEQGCCYP